MTINGCTMSKRQTMRERNVINAAKAYARIEAELEDDATQSAIPGVARDRLERAKRDLLRVARALQQDDDTIDREWRTQQKRREGMQAERARRVRTKRRLGRGDRFALPKQATAALREIVASS
jgi:hypothetical protein